MERIITGPYPDVDVPDGPLTPYVLRHAARLADHPALIDGSTGRTLRDACIRAGENAEENRILLHDLCDTMIDGSLCALGGMAPFPVLSVMKKFPDEL